MQNVLQLAPPPPAKVRLSRVDITSSTDSLLIPAHVNEETNSFAMLKTIQKSPGERVFISKVSIINLYFFPYGSLSLSLSLSFMFVNYFAATRTLTNESVNSVGNESLISYVLTPEMLAGGHRSRSGTVVSIQSQSSTFSNASTAQNRMSTGSNLLHQHYPSPSAAPAAGTCMDIQCTHCAV